MSELEAYSMDLARALTDVIRTWVHHGDHGDIGSEAQIEAKRRLSTALYNYGRAVARH